MVNIVSPTGGLGYHFKALRYGSLWQSHCKQVEDWLRRWNTSSNELILIGPSSGYSLPQSFLNRFNHVFASEPDPLARWLFQRRHKLKNLTWINFDFFSDINSLKPRAPLELRQKYPDAAILFCNILGQIPFLLKDREDHSIEWLKAFRKFCELGNWSSYHDLWSARLPIEQVHHGIRASTTLTDHLTKDLFGNELKLSRAQWYWSLTRHSTHCVEGVRLSKQESGA